MARVNKASGYVKLVTNLFVCLFYLGFMSLSTIFQSYGDGVWMWQGAQCSLLECCLTEISCPPPDTWHDTVFDLITALCVQIFQTYWEHSFVVKYVYLLRIHYEKDQKTDLFDDDYVIVSDFLYKGICCGHSFELHRQVDAIQMSTHNICFLKRSKEKLHWLQSEDYGISWMCAYRGMCGN